MVEALSARRLRSSEEEAIANRSRDVKRTREYRRRCTAQRSAWSLKLTHQVAIIVVPALVASFFPGVALADDECGQSNTSGAVPTVTCAPGTYSTGIVYSTSNAGMILTGDGLLVLTNPVRGVEINTNGVSGPISGPISMRLSGLFEAEGQVNIYGVSLLQSNPNATAFGDLTIDVTGEVDAQGQTDIRGIFLNNLTPSPANLSVIYRGPSIHVVGGDAAGIIARSAGGSGNVSIDASGGIIGNVPTNSQLLFGITAEADTTGSGSGSASVRYRMGAVGETSEIGLTGSRVFGINAVSHGDGSATVITDPGTSISLSGDENGNPHAAISLTARGGSAAGGQMVRGEIASTIDNTGSVAGDAGERSRNPIGIRATAYTDVPVTVIYTGAGITTDGGRGMGIVAQSGSGASTVQSSGPITTNGDRSFGILADSGSQPRPSLPLTSPGVSFPGDGPDDPASGIGGPVTVLSAAPITTHGSESHGIWANSATGAVDVSASNIVTTGEFGVGIKATGGSVTVSVPGAVTGGWQSSADGAGPNYQMPSSGVILGATSGTATLNNTGTIGALSDRAVAAADLYFQPGFPGNVNIVNNGTITGYVTLGSGNDTFQNLTPTSFDIRNFADTDGDGIRDTKAVAISDFGAGSDQFVNQAAGVVRLLPVTGAAITDATGYYVPTTGADSRPLESTFYDLNREGVVQGQLVNLETFANAGTIDLRNPAVGNALPVVGNSLVITGNPTAGGVPGSGLYVSNGGRLLVNTVLNGGIPVAGQTNSYSDMLVVDGTRLGTGATTIGVTNVGGSGVLTPGNGIGLVEVRNKAASDPGAFSLAGDYVTTQGEQAVVGGAYAYTLKFGGVGADGTDGNWYLRSQLIPPGPIPPNPPEPLFQAGVPIYEAYPQALLALMSMPTMQQRVGNRYWEQPLAPPNGLEGNGVWTRIEGLHSHIEPAVSTSGSDYDLDMWRLQAGLDGLLYEAQDGSRLIGGITVHYGQASSDVTSVFGDGGIDTDGYGFGGTLTWLGQNGIYVDGQASLTWFDSDLTSDTANRSLNDGNDGFGYALSVEAGKKIDLSGNWTITPQAQLIYANVDFDGFTDPFGADVSLGTGDSLRGRLGISADREQSWQDKAGKTSRSHVYGIANLYYEILDGSSVDISGVKFETRPERFWGGIGIGGSYNWNDDKYSVYGEVSANTSLESFGDSYAFNGTAGFRVKW